MPLSLANNSGVLLLLCAICPLLVISPLVPVILLLFYWNKTYKAWIILPNGLVYAAIDTTDYFCLSYSVESNLRTSSKLVQSIYTYRTDFNANKSALPQ